MIALLGCIALVLAVAYVNPIRQGADLVEMYGLARLIGVAQIAGCIGAAALFVMGVR